MKLEDIHVGDKLWACEGNAKPLLVTVTGQLSQTAWWTTFGVGCPAEGYSNDDLYQDEKSAFAAYESTLEVELHYVRQRLAQLEAEQCPNN